MSCGFYYVRKTNNFPFVGMDVETNKSMFMEAITVYKLIGGRNGKVGVKETLPHYMVMFL